MFKGTSSKDEVYFVNVCCELSFLLESLGRMKQCWVDWRDGSVKLHIMLTRQGQASSVARRLCQSAILVYDTNRDPKTHLCQWTSLQAQHQSHHDCLCSLRINKSPFHLRVLPKLAPKAHVDMLTSLDCSYEMWYLCSIRIWSQRSKAWLPTRERIGRDFIQGTTSGFVLGPIQLHADSVVNPKLLQSCLI